MMGWKIALGGFIVMLGATAALAQSRSQLQGPTVVGTLQGYRCMALNLRADQNSFDDLPPIRAEPSERSAEIGIASGTVIVAEPRREVDGFVAVLHLDGHPGWLEARMLRPWVNRSNPLTTCQPAMMSNGRPGFAYATPRG